MALKVEIPTYAPGVRLTKFLKPSLEEGEQQSHLSELKHYIKVRAVPPPTM
jgi:hypothetical protein